MYKSIRSTDKSNGQCTISSTTLKRSRLTFDVLCPSQATILTTSSRDDDIERMQRQRIKMEKLLIKFEQQKKCIEELQEYIDELQMINAEQNTEITQLKQRQEELLNSARSERSSRKDLAVDEKIEKEKITRMMRDQLRLYETEKLRWSKESQLKEKQFNDEKQAFIQSSKQGKMMLETKLKNQHKIFKDKEKEYCIKIQSLQLQNRQLRQKIVQIENKNSEVDELLEIINLRRDLAKRTQEEGEIMREKIDAEVLSQEVDRLKLQLQKLRKENCSLKNELESKQFDISLEHSNCPTERDIKALKEEYHMEISLIQQAKSQLEKQLQQYKVNESNWKASNKMMEQRLRDVQKINEEQHANSEQLRTKLDLFEHLRKSQQEQIYKMDKLFRKIKFNNQ